MTGPRLASDRTVNVIHIGPTAVQWRIPPGVTKPQLQDAAHRRLTPQINPRPGIATLRRG